MTGKKLTRKFFDRRTQKVAKDLLGKFLIRKIGKKTVTAMITETEAYCGPNDKASHASHGMTKRNAAMFGPPGHAYIYLIYGMHFCLNIVTERNGYPAAVLIRGALVRKSKTPKTLTPNIYNLKPTTYNLTPKTHNQTPDLNGPGKLCRYFQIDKTLNNEDLATNKKLWLEDRSTRLKLGQIRCGKRIGIDYAGSYKHKPWRFFVKFS